MSYTRPSHFITQHVLDQYKDTSICKLVDKYILYLDGLAEIANDILTNEKEVSPGSIVGFGLNHCNCYYTGSLSCCDTQQVKPMTTDYTFTDDELYNRFLDAKIYSDKSLGSLRETIEGIKILYNCDAALFSNTVGNFTVVISRPFTEEEVRLFPLARRILLKYPTINLTFGFIEESHKLSDIADGSVDDCEGFSPNICYGL